MKKREFKKLPEGMTVESMEEIFTDIETEMRGLEWGRLYEEYHKKAYNPTKVLAEMRKLYGDPYIKNRKGIFEYILGGSTDTKLLEVRVFDEATKRSTYESQTAKANKKEESNCSLCAVGHDANKEKIKKLHVYFLMQTEVGIVICKITYFLPTNRFSALQKQF